MIKPVIEDLDLERGNAIEIERIEIVTDTSDPEQVEIYLLNEAGERIEGGTFAKAGLMRAIMDFYNREY